MITYSLRAITVIAILILTCPLSGLTASPPRQNPARRPLLIAHRGASAYAPEHTLAAYRLAIEQGADFVEQDLQVTKDGVLICSHDGELSRTTDVAEVFPDRATLRDPEGKGEPRRGWYAVDFTLAEVKRLDAGGWFNRANPFAARPAFVKERIPTLEEAIKIIGGRAGLYVEMKHFEFYKSLGHDMAGKLAAVLKANGFDNQSGARRVFIQSFSKASLLHLRDLAPRYQRVQLLPMEDAGRGEETSRVTSALAGEIATYAQGAGPSKTMIKSADDVAVFHKANLMVHPYTFRGPTTAVSRRPLGELLASGSTLGNTIIADIRQFVAFGIDGGFTDYPDLWKQAIKVR